MTTQELLNQLKELGTEQNRKIYARHGITGDVYGVSFANLTKLKKKIKTNHHLAIDLWNSKNADARNLAFMIADPQQTTLALLEQWHSDLTCHAHANMLANFAQKTAYAQTLVKQWMESDDELSEYAGWGLLAALAMNDTQLDDSYFANWLIEIENTIHSSKNFTKHSMNSALIAIGIRNEHLKEKAQAAAQRIGKVEVDHGQTCCKTPDAISYIDRAWLRKKNKK